MRVALAIVLALAAFWAVGWPLVAGLDAAGPAMRAGVYATLAVWVAVLVAGCARRRPRDD